MANYLITGGCGFVGSHLAMGLQQAGHGIRVLDNLSRGRPEHLPGGVDMVVGDVTELAQVEQALLGMDGCFHLAATGRIPSGRQDWAVAHQTNLTGTLHVLEAAKARQTPVVYASSASVYGDNAAIPLTETAAPRPLSSEGADKLSAELHARVASLMYGVPTMGLRLFNVYGPGPFRYGSATGVIATFLEQLARRESLVLYGDGEQTRDFVYINDAVAFFMAAMRHIDRSPAVYNVCTGGAVSINRLARMMMSMTGVQVPLRYQSGYRGDRLVSVGAPGQASRQLGIEAKVSLLEGLRLLVAKAFPDTLGSFQPRPLLATC